MACAWIGLRPNSRHQAFARLRGRSRGADERDHLVDVVQRDLQPLEDVRPGFGLPQLEFDPPPDDVAAELDEMVQHLRERQDARPPGDDRQHDDAEGGLQRRVLVEVVQDDVGQLVRA